MEKEKLKPVWSVTIPTFNSSKFIAETLASVLQADLGEAQMEIIVVDNCSTDNTLDIVKEIGRERVKIIKNDRNIGMMQNFNKCIEVANGKYLHLLNSDDLIFPEFYTKYNDLLNKYTDVYLFSCVSLLINEEGIIHGCTELIKSLASPSNNVEDFLYVNPLRTPSVVVKKEAYEKLGGFDPSLPQTADWDMWVRIIHNFRGLNISDKLVKYREHIHSGTSSITQTGREIKDLFDLYDKFERQRLYKDLNRLNRHKQMIINTNLEQAIKKRQSKRFYILSKLYIYNWGIFKYVYRFLIGVKKSILHRL